MALGTGTSGGAATPLGSSRSAATDATLLIRPPATPPMPPMREPQGGRGTSLTMRIFIGTAGVVALVLAVSLVIASFAAQRSANASIAAALEAVRQRVVDRMASERTALVARAGTFADNPSFRSLLGSTDTAAYHDYFDQSQVAASSIGADWTQLTDAQGRRLARSDDSSAAHVDLGGTSLIAGALGGEETTGVGIAGDSALIQAVAVPIFSSPGHVIGALMAARYLTDSVVRVLGRTAGSELAFFALDRQGNITVVATTAGLRDWAAVRALVQRQMASGRVRGMDSASMAVSGSGMNPDDRLMIDDQHYVGESQALLGATGAPVGGFLALRSLDGELAAFYSFRRVMLLTALAGLVVAFLLSGAVARQIGRPVRALAVAAARASDGDYGAEIPAAGRDDIGVLAAAFKRLLADLRDKQALVDLLGDTGGGRTLPVDTQPRRGATTALMDGATLSPGQLLANRYEIREVLGVGGMGMVYRAQDRELGESVAIKTLKPDLVAQDPSALDRFKSEIRLARRISHRNVVRTHDLGESAGVYFISMELVEGRSLKELIRSRGRLKAGAVLPIAKQLCRALAVAHEAGVIHRDIKPHNVVIGADGVVKVMDFGIARLAEGTSGYTQAGMVVGTPEYMAPEQLVGDDVDARADIYALGAVLYECLTGAPPFTADNAIVLITKVLEETPVAPAERYSDVPRAMSDIVLRALAKQRDARPNSASEVHEMLEQVQV